MDKYIQKVDDSVGRSAFAFPECLRCPLTAATVNAGPRTVCVKHTDSRNLSFGQCLVMPFGDFDWTKGGHVDLHEVNLRVEVKPGDVLCIPSAVIPHSNSDIGASETRFSFTLYSSGQHFQWIENDFTCQKDLTGPKPSPLALQQRWEEGWKLYGNALA